MPWIFILTPTLGWAWPALIPLATAAAAVLGYKKLTETGEKGWLQGRLTKKLHDIRRETLALDEILTEVISDDLGREERLAFEREGFLLVFRKDGRGKFWIEVSGPRSESALNLKLRGEEFAHELIRKFAYHKMVEQIERRGATVIEEEIREDGAVVLRSRQWR